MGLRRAAVALAVSLAATGCTESGPGAAPGCLDRVLASYRELAEPTGRVLDGTGSLTGAMRSYREAAGDAAEAARSCAEEVGEDASACREAIGDLASSLRDAAEEVVDEARDARGRALQRIAGALEGQQARLEGAAASAASCASRTQ